MTTPSIMPPAVARACGVIRNSDCFREDPAKWPPEVLYACAEVACKFTRDLAPIIERLVADLRAMVAGCKCGGSGTVETVNNAAPPILYSWVGSQPCPTCSGPRRTLGEWEVQGGK